MSCTDSVVSEEVGVLYELAMPTHVLIVEDHPLVAAATADLLRREHPQLHSVTVSSAQEAAALADRNWFLIFLDLNVPGAQGLSLLRVFSERGLANRCCIVTGATDERLVMEAKQLGVLGYIEKSWPVQEFCVAIDSVVHGTAVFPIVGKPSAGIVPQLTGKQTAVLRLLHRGLSSKQIAHEMNLAEGTVKNYTLALLRALNASNRAHAVARAIELDLIDVWL